MVRGILVLSMVSVAVCAPSKQLRDDIEVIWKENKDQLTLVTTYQLASYYNIMVL